MEEGVRRLAKRQHLAASLNIRSRRKKKQEIDSENASLTNTGNYPTSGMPQQCKALEASENWWAYCALVVRKDFFVLVHPHHVLLPASFSHFYSPLLYRNSRSHGSVNVTVQHCHIARANVMTIRLYQSINAFLSSLQGQELLNNISSNQADCIYTALTGGRWEKKLKLQDEALVCI